MILFHLRTQGKCYCILRTTRFVVLGAYTLNNQIINFSDDNLVVQGHISTELKVRGCFDESILRSMQGLCMGDIHFAEIHTTFKMCLVPFCMFLQFAKKGSFNADNLPADSYSHTMAILLGFIPDPRLMDIERVGIGNIIRRHGSPLGGIDSINMVITQICVVLASEHDKASPKCRAYMMLIGNYGGHMAFDTNPPYCVAYAAEYKNTDNPSKMTFQEPLNHGFAMVASNMVVRRLLSVPNWDPAERKLTTGGHLLIPRGMHFGPELFPDLLMTRNHRAPLIDSITWQEVPFWMVGPFRAMDPIFSGHPGDLELFTAEEVAKLKELGVLNPPNMPGHLPLFPPLVSSSRGKVVSVALGAPPPSLDTYRIGQSLAADQDKESILSESFRPSLHHIGQQHYVGQAHHVQLG